MFMYFFFIDHVKHTKKVAKTKYSEVKKEKLKERQNYKSQEKGTMKNSVSTRRRKNRANKPGNRNITRRIELKKMMTKQCVETSQGIAKVRIIKKKKPVYHMRRIDLAAANRR